MAQPPPNPPQKPSDDTPGPIWPSAVLLAFSLYFMVQLLSAQQLTTLSYSEFLKQVDGGQIASVLIRGEELKGRYRQSQEQNTSSYEFRTVVPHVENARLLELLSQHHVEIHAQADEAPFWAQLLIGFLPWLLILGLFIWSSRALREKMGGGTGLYGFGRSRARRYEVSRNGPHYRDIAGAEAAKQELQEVIDFLKNPAKYRAMGAHMPKGILMMGAPGTGKTLLAKATATEAGVPFYSVSGSEFIEMFVGVGASRVRDMFAQARKDAPALIFIDEIDSVGRVRGTGLGGGNDEREQTLNQVLAEMDGFDPDEAIVVLAATNRPDVLDPALLRPGRFDRKITLELPQRQARIEILKVHCQKIPLAEGIVLEDIAAATPGFSGADLANIVNEAALAAARASRQQVNQQDLLEARDKVVMGAPRSDLLNPRERRRTACHEAGHALAAFFSPHSDPVQKISIVPRGRALGMTEQIPEEDRHNLNEEYLRDKLTILMGGRCAERLMFGNISTGASDDLKQATKLAYKMVAQWGMSENLGAVGYSLAEEHPFLGRELSQAREFSEATAAQIDTAVSTILKEAEQRCRELLTEHQQALQAMLDALLEKETLGQEEINALLQDHGTEAPQHAY